MQYLRRLLKSLYNIIIKWSTFIELTTLVFIRKFIHGKRPQNRWLMKKVTSLKKTLLNNFLFISIVPFIIALAVSVIYLATYLSDSVEEGHETYLNLLEYEIGKSILEPMEMLHVVDELYYDEVIDDEHFPVFLDVVLAENNIFETLKVVGAEGRVVSTPTSELNTVGFDMSYQPFYINRESYDDFYWSDIFMSTKTSNATIALTLKGKGNYYVTAHFSLKDIQSLVNELANQEGNVYTIVDETGYYIAHSDFSKVAQRTVDEYFDSYDLKDSMMLTYDDLTYIGRVSRMSDLPFYIMVRTPYYNQYLNIIKVVITGFVILLSVTVIIIYLASEQAMAIIKPIKYLISETDKISAGCYGEEIHMNSYDEINALVQYFNEMSITVKKNFDYLSASQAEMESLNQDLTIQNEEIAKSEMEIASILGNLYSGIILLSPDLVITRMNQAVYTLLGITGEVNALGKNIIDFLAFEEEVCNKNTFDLAFFSRKKISKIIEKPTALIEQSILPLIADNDEITGVIVTLDDVTEQHKLEAQLNRSMKMEAIGRLSGGIAHDFNNILQVIIGYGELIEISLSQNENSEKALQQMGLITDSAKKAEKLVRQLMLFSKIDMVKPGLLNVNECVKDISEMLSGIIGDNIQLYTDMDEGVKLIVADSTQIEQTIMNLCVNAKDAMPHGGNINLRTYNMTKNNKVYTTIEVADTGSGIPKHIQDKVFDPFFTTKEVGKGTGLGLATVLGIVEKNHGFVDMTTELGRGTVFKLYFPAVDGRTNEQAFSDTLNLKGSCVLLVEDDPIVRGQTEEVIRGAGGLVILAVNGQDAIEQFYEHKDSIDILMVDVLMQSVDGLKVYEIVHNMAPKVKIIFTSVYSNELISMEAMTQVAGKILQKPYERVTLLSTLYEINSQ